MQRIEIIVALQSFLMVEISPIQAVVDIVFFLVKVWTWNRGSKTGSRRFGSCSFGIPSTGRKKAEENDLIVGSLTGRRWNSSAEEVWRWNITSSSWNFSVNPSSYVNNINLLALETSAEQTFFWELPHLKFIQIASYRACPKKGRGAKTCDKKKHHRWEWPDEVETGDRIRAGFWIHIGQLHLVRIIPKASHGLFSCPLSPFFHAKISKTWKNAVLPVNGLALAISLVFRDVTYDMRWRLKVHPTSPPPR